MLAMRHTKVFRYKYPCQNLKDISRYSQTVSFLGKVWI
jgi:hypothetical protein